MTDTEETFDNKAFWSDRYVRAGWIGSGPGSRGIAADYKAILILDFIKTKGITSIIDVGCGDLCWLDACADRFAELGIAYRGLDIADTIVSLNRACFPQYEFAVFDLGSMSLPTDADLVVCLDVLIHQTTASQFDAALATLLRGTAKYALISYRTPSSVSPVMPLIADETSQQRELEFQSQLKAQQRDVRLAKTHIHGDFLRLVNEREPSIAISAVGQYRYQTVYELRRLSP